MPCKDHLKCTERIPLVKSGILPECSWYKSAEGCTFGDKCSFAHRRVEEQTSKKGPTKVHWLY